MKNCIRIEDEKELGVFESKCKELESRLNMLKEQLSNQTQALGQFWRDNEYNNLCSRVCPINSECNKAIDVINQSLLPFVARKRDALGYRPVVQK